MIQKLKEKCKDSIAFKFRLLIIVFAIFCISTYSVGYAYFSQILNTTGEIDVVVTESQIEITSISSPTIKKDAVENSTPTYSGTSATFSVQLPKTNSSLVYSITVKNTGTSNVKYDDTSISTNNDAITYRIDGVDRFTVLEPNETLTFQVTINYTEEYQYSYPSSKTARFTLEFLFNPTFRGKYQSLSGYIVEDTGNVTETEYGAPATIVIQNDNNYELNFTLYGQNNFVVYNQEGIEQTYTIGANASLTLPSYIKDSSTANAIGTSPTVSIMAKVTDSNVSKTSLIDTIDLTLENKGKYEVLSDGYTETSSDVDYSSTNTTTGGIYSEVGINGEKTYYYRGSVSNNYFSFAGYTWRILRLDENSNIRLILNSLIQSSGSTATQQFKTTNTANSLDAAKTLSKLIVDPTSTSNNSPIYGYLTDTSTTTLRGWYNNNIAGTNYENYVADSVFCMDTDGGNATSSGTYTSVFYFASYQKLGVDTALYDPDFGCIESNQITEKIGLLTADEYVFAGGAFRATNTTFFLNDSGISTAWWTMSPAYYDENLKTVGVFMVYANGSITDWPNGNTLTNSYGIRPVITVKGDKELLGTGTSSDPYRFE